MSRSAPQVAPPTPQTHVLPVIKGPTVHGIRCSNPGESAEHTLCHPCRRVSGAQTPSTAGKIAEDCPRKLSERDPAQRWRVTIRNLVNALRRKANVQNCNVLNDI